MLLLLLLPLLLPLLLLVVMVRVRMVEVVRVVDVEFKKHVAWCTRSCMIGE